MPMGIRLSQAESKSIGGGFQTRPRLFCLNLPHSQMGTPYSMWYTRAAVSWNMSARSVAE